MADPPGPPSPHRSPAVVASGTVTLTSVPFIPKLQTPQSIHVARRAARLVRFCIASPSSQLIYHTVSAVHVHPTFTPNTVQADQVSSLSQVFPASVLVLSSSVVPPQAAHRPPVTDRTGDSSLVMRPSTPPARSRRGYYTSNKRTWISPTSLV